MNCQHEGKYRGWGRGTRALAVVVGLWVAGLVAGCSGFADEVHQEPASGAESDDGARAAMGLYDAMVVVFREDTAGVDRAMEESLIVISHYEAVDDDRRRRFIGQVVPLQGGIGVRITAEYQRESEEADGGWEDQPREAVEAEASAEELSLARSVERRYHAGE